MARSNVLKVLAPAVLLVVAAVPAGPARAAGTAGRKCAFNSVTDFMAPPGQQLAVVNAGPLYTGEAGTLVCTIVVNANAHSADGTPVRGTAINGVVVIPPTPTPYTATAADTVALCTKWVGASGTRYWVGQQPPYGLGYWSTDANSPCGEAISGPYDPFCPLWLTVDKYAGTPLAEVWQDCEPYEPII